MRKRPSMIKELERDLDNYHEIDSNILRLNRSIVAENEKEWRKVQMLVKSVKRMEKIKKIFNL